MTTTQAIAQTISGKREQRKKVGSKKNETVQ